MIILPINILPNEYIQCSQIFSTFTMLENTKREGSYQSSFVRLGVPDTLSFLKTIFKGKKVSNERKNPEKIFARNSNSGWPSHPFRSNWYIVKLLV